VSPILGIWASQNYSRYSLPTSYDSIATATVGSGGAANVEFTSIPSTYTHLQIRALGRTDRAATGDWISIQFNGTTSSSYALHELVGDGSSASAGFNSSVTATAVQRFAGANATASVFGVFVLDILDYTNTNKNTTIRGLGGTDNNGSGIVSLTSGLFNSTNAITSIKFFPGAGSNFAQYSSFALFGIKGA
jgi:hypothetical protein